MEVLVEVGWDPVGEGLCGGNWVQGLDLREGELRG